MHHAPAVHRDLTMYRALEGQALCPAAPLDHLFTDAFHPGRLFRGAISELYAQLGIQVPQVSASVVPGYSDAAHALGRDYWLVPERP